MGFGILEQFGQGLLKTGKLRYRQVGHELAFELNGAGPGSREELFACRGERRSQDPTMLRIFAPPDQSLAFEGSDQLNDGLRADAHGARQVRARYARRLLDLKEDQELGGRQIEPRQPGLRTAANGQFRSFQKINDADWSGFSQAHFGAFSAKGPGILHDPIALAGVAIAVPSRKFCAGVRAGGPAA
jgi:hypothetical protein